MLISKELEGATVERVYWAVPATNWLPSIGVEHDSLKAAQDYADRRIAETVYTNSLTITSRVIFRKPDGTSVDMEMGRETRYR